LTRLQRSSRYAGAISRPRYRLIFKASGVSLSADFDMRKGSGRRGVR
jgi:hypothetical protein